MSNIKSIRRMLHMTQSDLAVVFGQSKGNISHYESGKQDLPPANARKLIEFAKNNGRSLTFDDIYGAQVGAGETVPTQQEAA